MDGISKNSSFSSSSTFFSSSSGAYSTQNTTTQNPTTRISSTSVINTTPETIIRPVYHLPTNRMELENLTQELQRLSVGSFTGYPYFDGVKYRENQLQISALISALEQTNWFTLSTNMTPLLRLAQLMIVCGPHIAEAQSITKTLVNLFWSGPKVLTAAQFNEFELLFEQALIAGNLQAAEWIYQYPDILDYPDFLNRRPGGSIDRRTFFLKYLKFMTEFDINEAANINFLRDLTKVNLNEKIRFTSPPIWAFLMGHFDGYREYSDYQSMCRSLATMVYFEDLDLLAEYDNRKSALHFLVDGRYIEAIYIMLKALHLRGEINETRKEYFKEIIDTAILSYKGPTHDKKQRAIISSVEGKVIDAKSPIEVLAALGVLKLFNTEEINDLREQAKKHARSIGGTVNGHIPHDMPTLNCLKSYLTPGAVEQTPLDHTRSFR